MIQETDTQALSTLMVSKITYYNKIRLFYPISRIPAKRRRKEGEV